MYFESIVEKYVLLFLEFECSNKVYFELFIVLREVVFYLLDGVGYYISELFYL